MMKTVYFITVIVLALVPFCSSEAQRERAEEPDLDVLFIEQWPVYPGYPCHYPGNLPVLVHPGSGRDGTPLKYYYTRDEYEANVKTHPDEGETVTCTAYVANKGGVKVERSEYVFRIDDRVVKKGRLPALEPGEKTTIAIEWPYKSGRHFVSFEVDPDNRIEEICEVNNIRKDPTFGFVLTITAGNKGEYPAFNSTENLVGSYSFEDWCQAHIDKWREYFSEAKYPSTPDGVQAGIRFNYIFPEDEGEEWQTYRDKGGWCNWRIYWDTGNIPDYAKGIDGGLIHELVHQCGVIDTYAIGLGMLDNLALDPETGKTVAIPYADHRRIHPTMMGGSEREELKGAFSEHEAAAFDAILKRWDHHAGYGLYLFDMPRSNIVQFLNNRGEPLADGILTIWQQWASPQYMNRISRKTNIATPRQVRLDEDGSFNLGRNPYNTLWVVGGNCIMMFCVRAYDQKEYHFIDVREMNIAYWRGNEKEHTYVFQTNIAPVGSPNPPTLRIVPDESDRTKATLAWDAPEKDIATYRIRWNLDMMSAFYEPAFEPVKEVPGDTTRTTIELHPRIDYTQFTVTAVDSDGNESRCAEPIVWPVREQVTLGLVRPIGVAIGPDESMYVIDNHIGTIFGVDKKGNLLNFADTAMIGSGAIQGITVTPLNRMFVTAWRGQGIVEIDPEKGTVLKRFAGSREKSSTPGKMSYPYGIASDQHNRLYVSDRDTGTIQIYDPEGTYLAALDAGFEDVRGIGVTAKDNKTIVAVTEFMKKTITILELDPKTYKLLDKEEIMTEKRPLCACFDDSGRLYIGTVQGIDRYENGKRTGYWESKFNKKGRQVWGISIKGDLLTCSEGSDNEKYWMKGSLEDFRTIE